MFVPRGARVRADRRAEPPRDAARRPGGEPQFVYFRSQRGLVEERDRIRASMGVTFESDVKPQERFLIERFVTASVALRGEARERGGVLYFDNPAIKAADVRPALSVLSLDLETDGFDGPLLSAAVATRETERVFVCGAGGDRDAITFVPDQRALLTSLFGRSGRSIRTSSWGGTFDRLRPRGPGGTLPRAPRPLRQWPRRRERARARRRLVPAA